MSHIEKIFIMAIMMMVIIVMMMVMVMMMIVMVICWAMASSGSCKPSICSWLNLQRGFQQTAHCTFSTQIDNLDIFFLKHSYWILPFRRQWVAQMQSKHGKDIISKNPGNTSKKSNPCLHFSLVSMYCILHSNVPKYVLFYCYHILCTWYSIYVSIEFYSLHCWDFISVH